MSASPKSPRKVRPLYDCIAPYMEQLATAGKTKSDVAYLGPSDNTVDRIIAADKPVLFSKMVRFAQSLIELLSLRDVPEELATRLSVPLGEVGPKPGTVAHWRESLLGSDWTAKIVQDPGVNFEGHDFPGESGTYAVTFFVRGGRLLGEARGDSGNAQGEWFSLRVEIDSDRFVRLEGRREGMATHFWMALVRFGEGEQEGTLKGGYAVYEPKYRAIAVGTLEVTRVIPKINSQPVGKAGGEHPRQKKSRVREVQEKD